MPFGADRLSAVLTLPEKEARGLVLMSRGLRGRITTRVAWALADAGIASIRVDPPGTGDSTGTFRSGREASAVPWVSAALEVAGRATGIQRLAIFGYCQAAATAVSAAAELPSVSAVLIVVRGGAFKGARPGAARPAGFAPAEWLLRSRRIGRRILSSIRGRRRSDRAAADRRRDRGGMVHRSQTLIRDIARAAPSTDILALYVGEPRAAEDVERRVASLRGSISSATRRFEVRRTTAIPRGFQIPYERLDEVASLLAGWLDEVIDRPIGTPGTMGRAS